MNPTVLKVIQNRWAHLALVAVACLAVGRWSGRTNGSEFQDVIGGSSSVSTVTETVTVEKPVETIHEHTVYRDGPIQFVDREVTRTADKVVDTKNENTQTETKTEEKTKIITPSEAPRFTVMGSIALATKSSGPLYGGQITYRVAGPLVVGAGVLAGSQFVGVASIGFTF